MAAAYVVSLPVGTSARQLQNSVDMVVVYANDSTDAKAMAKAAMGADANPMWDNADVTAITANTTPLGWRFVVNEYLTNGQLGRHADITAAGGSQDTIDEVGTALATALSLTGATVTYTAGTQVLLFDATGSGDRTLELKVYPPATAPVVGIAVGQDYPIPGFTGAYVHEGAAADALSVALCADAFVIPSLIARGTLRP